MADRFSLEGRTAVVTGCRRGIGLAAAMALAEAGADIVGVSASLEDDGGEAGRAVRGAGRAFTGYRCDFGDRAAVYGFVESLERDVPQVDILVNNAGVVLRAPTVEHTDEMWDRVLEVDLSAQFVLARELGRKMVARRSGKIVFVASLMAFQGGINIPGYAAAKGGIAQLTKALANEWAQHGVNVNAVAPGYIQTDINEALWEDPERHRQILERIPAGRWGGSGDLAGAIVFLAAEASSYVHGVVLPVDGGWLGR